MSPHRMDKRALYDALSAHSADPEDSGANRALEERLWAALGAERAVLVSDLSGFTRITRERGILHFLAVFERAHRIGARVFAARRGRFLKTQADNLFALFDDVGHAAAAAQDLLAEAALLNAALPDPSTHVRFCIGLGWGRILELADDAFGDPINIAFKLGEDIAEPGQILVSEDAALELRSAPVHAALAATLHGPLEADAGSVAVRHWLLPARPDGKSL